MSEFTKETFNDAVQRYFGAIAREHGWTLVQRRDDLFRMSSRCAVMEIDYHQGWHTRSMNIIVRPANDPPGSPRQIGVWPIASFNGESFQYVPWEQNAEGFFEEAEYMANLAKRFCVPYLSAERTDWELVKSHWERESEKAIEKIKGYKFPSGAQKRWHLPPPASFLLSFF